MALQPESSKPSAIPNVSGYSMLLWLSTVDSILFKVCLTCRKYKRCTPIGFTGSGYKHRRRIDGEILLYFADLLLSHMMGI